MKRLGFLIAALLPLSTALAQLQLAPQSGAPVPELKPIAGPVPIPMPLWEIIALAGAGAAVLALILWLIVRRKKKGPPPLPPTPRQIALSALEAIHAQISTLEPYTFSIAVCDILRAYVSRQFQLGAPRQTSPEFLAGIAESPRFLAAEKALLAQFLEKCDLIKFAHINATTDDSAALWQQARDFVTGGAA
jgi:hypothetical protein